MLFAAVVPSICLVAVCFTSSVQATLPLTISHAGLRNDSCPVDAGTRASVMQTVKQTLDKVNTILNQRILCPCNTGQEWRRIAYVNMTDSSQQCPANLTFHSSPVRGCGRQSTAGGRCDSTFFSTDLTYSHVCGRIAAVQRGTPDAFYNAVSLGMNSIEQAYVDGISLTHGSAGSRQHIWTFAAAINQGDRRNNGEVICACTDASFNWGHQVPSFVGNDYFCDTGNLNPTYSFNTYFTNNPLWDGVGCAAASTCCELNMPPWFCATLPHPTSDNLELRLCHGERESSEEDIIITLIDMYVA